MISVEEYEGSPEFQALLVASEGKPAREMGDSVIPAEPPQWKVVSSTARSLLKNSPVHLAAIVNLVKAEANLKGYPGMCAALEELKSALVNQWDEMYPESDPDDPEDMYYARINLMRELPDEPAFIDELYRVPVVSVRAIGEYSCRDIDISRGVLSGSEEDTARCQDGLIRGAFQESDPIALQATSDALSKIRTLCEEIEALFTEKAGTYNTLSMGGLSKKIGTWHELFSEYASDFIESPETDAGAEENTSDNMGGSNVPQAKATGLIKDRQQALHALDRVIEYYCESEPSSPVGVLAQRAKNMFTKPFFAVLQELAPSETDSFDTVLVSLTNNPTAFLLNDSYHRYLGGEQFPSVPSPRTPSSEIPICPPAQHSQNEQTAVTEPAAANEAEITATENPETVSAETNNPEAVSAETQNPGIENPETVDAETDSPAIENTDSETPQAQPGSEESNNSDQLNGAGADGLSHHLLNGSTASAPETNPINNNAVPSSRTQLLDQVSSRNDVIAVLGELEQYFIEQEPSSPIPLVLAEMKKLVPKRFSELLAEFSRGVVVNKEVVTE